MRSSPVVVVFDGRPVQHTKSGGPRSFPVVDRNHDVGGVDRTSGVDGIIDRNGAAAVAT
jgi:hypothetical protein